MSTKQKELIDRGLAYLAKTQGEDGSWHTQYNIAVSALAGLAFLGAGHTPARGPYWSHINKIVTVLLSHQDKDGLIAYPNDSHAMYGHGYSTLFLTQVYGMTDFPDPQKIKHALKKAIKLIVQSQSHRGGWFYHARPSEDEGSVTITQIQALRAARDVGIEVPYDTIKKSIEYVEKSQCHDGGIAYEPGRAGTQTVALTAAGMAVLFNAGEYEIGDSQERGFRYLDKYFSDMFDLRQHRFFMYTHFYAAQVYKLRGEEEFEKYFTNIAHVLVEKANSESDGSVHWKISEIGQIFSTAIALLILEMPLEYLPIFTN